MPRRAAADRGRVYHPDSSGILGACPPFIDNRAVSALRLMAAAAVASLLAIAVGFATELGRFGCAIYPLFRLGPGVVAVRIMQAPM